MDDSTTAAGAFCRGTRRRGPSHKHTRRRRRRPGMDFSAAAFRRAAWWSRSSLHHVRGRGCRRRHSVRSAAAAQRRGTRRRGPSHRRNHARYRRHRRSGVDLSAAALPRRAGTPFRGRSGCGPARRPEPRGRRRSRIHSPRRTRQTDDWSWATEDGDELGRRVPQQLPRERASWRRRWRQRHGCAVVGDRLRIECRGFSVTIDPISP